MSEPVRREEVWRGVAINAIIVGRRLDSL